jgi:hypothetical protein
MASRVTWNGQKFLLLLKAELRKRIFACVIAIQNHAKKLINVEGAAKGPKGKLQYGAARSRPGQPPRKQKGRLQASVASEVGEQGGQPAGRAGTNVPYGRALEGGASATRDSAFGRKTKPYKWTLLARPWLRRALKEMLGFCRTVMSRPMKF